MSPNSDTHDSYKLSNCFIADHRLIVASGKKVATTLIFRGKRVSTRLLKMNPTRRQGPSTFYLRKSSSSVTQGYLLYKFLGVAEGSPLQQPSGEVTKTDPSLQKTINCSSGAG